MLDRFRTSPGLVLNLSRIGERGGLREFSESVVKCVCNAYPGTGIVAPRWRKAGPKINACYVPNFLATASTVSKLRPILWWLYAALLFPVRRGTRILSTTHQVLPWRRNQIVTVHDLRPYFLPDTIIQQLYFRFVLPRALRKCDGVLTVSETTKRKLNNKYLVPESKIFVVPNYIDTNRFTPGRAADVAPYLLVVGCTWKHKNLQEVLDNSETWENAYELKVVAAKSAYMQQMKRLVVERNLSQKVMFFEDIPAGELVQLYRNCSALLYPSQMEGFGIPPLEAMACGRPVIVSDIPVFHETYSSVPFYVRLGDKSSWLQAFRGLQNQELVQQKIDAGVMLASTFNYERMCSALSQALNGIWQMDFRRANSGADALAAPPQSELEISRR